jgi:hypothetical protein
MFVLARCSVKTNAVILAKARIQVVTHAASVNFAVLHTARNHLGSSFRWNDECG